jgi:hypothetical protein
MWRSALALALAVAVVAGCGGGGSRESPGPSPLVGAHGVKLRLAPGWHLARTNLTPRLVNPHDILSVGTFPMQPGGRCSQLPARAYSEMRKRDGLITILERRKGHGIPARPAHFRLHPHPRSFECAPAKLDGQEVAFSDAGRHFYVFVALGSNGPRRQAESILDSFSVRR